MNGTVSQTVSQKHAYVIRRNGIFYFSRRVPSDLQTRFNKERVTISLRTRSQVKAEKSAEALSDRLERYWDGLRLEIFHTTELGLTQLVSPRVCDTIKSVSVKEALDNYLRLKGEGRSITFLQAANRSANYLIESTGITELEALNAQHAAGFRDCLFARGMTASSVRRVFGNIRAIVNLAIKEHGLEYPNVFANTFIPDDERTKKRLPIPTDCIYRIQEECRLIDDEKRWLIALISDTGMRLAEAVGLHTSDIKLDDEIPFLRVQKHPWRSLKTLGSERDIPLVGASLWAAQRIIDQGSQFAFPTYTNSNKCSANSASGALNKWLKLRVPEGCVIHSFRHSLRDRLRAVECPPDIADSIGGWSSSSVGERYGTGHGLRTKLKHLETVINYFG